MPGYLETLQEQSVSVILGGREVIIPRARLGLYIRLKQIADEFDAAPGYAELNTAIEQYFAACGVEIGPAQPVEVLAAFAVLRELNQWQMSLAFMTGPGGAKGEPLPYEYDGRNWAWIVHKLASRYGWTDDYILSLYPERAACYLQEILVSETTEAEERYSLTELAYKYDSTTKQSSYVPFPKPDWMIPKVDPKPVRIARSFLPYGVVDLDGNPKLYH